MTDDTKGNEMNTQALNDYSGLMRQLIISHTRTAAEFAKEMINDDLDETLTVKQIISMIAGAAIDFIAQDLDPDNGDMNTVPKGMQEAIEKFVRANFKFGFELA